MSNFICPHCGTVGTPKTLTKGSIFIEIVLWITFIVPGVIYSIWRHASRAKVCRACESEKMIPLDTPLGRKLQNEFK